MRKILITVCLILSVSCAMVYADYKTEYPWAADAVDYFMDAEILKGDENGNLMLGDGLTQAQAMTLISRAFGLNDIYSEVDVNIDRNHWAAEYVSAVGDYIIFPDSFEADGFASRELFFSTVTSAAGLEPDEHKSVMLAAFTDCSKVRLEYFPYLTAAYNKGILKGNDGKINPRDSLTRAEAVTVLYRTMEVTGNLSVSRTPLVGEPEVTLEQAKQWAKAKGAAEIFIDVADLYWKYGEITTIRPEVMYAQAAKETGYGRYGGKVTPEMNNWAGIKVYGATGDETADHETFATPDDGVRGHFNHMSAYIGLEPVGEPHGRYRSVKSLAWAGTVKYVEELGGKWCPNTEYGVDIVGMIKNMQSY